jgi:exosortase/archaeosortase family protein
MAGTMTVTDRREPLPALVVAAVGLVASAVVIVVANHAVRVFETQVSAALVRFTGGHDVGTLGTNVLFQAKGRYVGFTLDAGCSAAFLLAPFLLLAAGLLSTGRVSVRRGLGSLAVALVAVFAANQARFLVIAAAIRSWGLDRGYARSHVFLGTIVSTLGVLGGVLVFFVLATGDRARPSGGIPDRADG